MRSSPRRTIDPPRVWTAVKWGLCLVVLTFVAARAKQLWQQDTVERLRVSPGWFVLAGIVYAAGWLPSVWFWRRLLHASGCDVRGIDAARAYYCGHLGKYVPGKAMVLVIRSALLKDRGASPGAAAVMTGCETVLMMGAGAVIAIAYSIPAILEARDIDATWISRLLAIPDFSLILAAAVLVLVSPIVARLLGKLAIRFTPAVESSTSCDTGSASASGESLDGGALAEPAGHKNGRPIRLGTGLVAFGLLLFVAAWMIHGLSLGLTLRGIDPAAFHWSDWPVWTAAVAGATVLGFVALFAPGGVGVREGLLIETLRLEPSIGEKHAVAAAILLRAVWIVAEIGLAGALYYLVRPDRKSRVQSPESRAGD